MRSALPRTPDLLLAPCPLDTNRTDFASTEHMLLGNAATGNELVKELRLKDGTKLSFGEVVALSGDFVGSVAELRTLAETPAGQDELIWARWLALGQGREPEPNVPAEAKKRVLLRLAGLAADNSTHFSHGGTALETYKRGHAEALRKAHEAGATGNDALFAAAVTDEACSQHFLSDTFSAGHIRAPVAEIRETYRREQPDSVNQILKYVVKRIVQSLDARGDVPWFWPRSLVESKALEAIHKNAGTIIGKFSLGDVVALACHNTDGNGLNVVSAVYPSGLPAPGGFHWRADGDSKLKPGSTTWRMALGAMRASRLELELARAQGSKTPKEPLAPVYLATRFIPRDDAAKNPVFAWRWGAMNTYMVDAINVCLREVLVTQLRRYPPEYAVVRFDNWGNLDPNGPVALHVGEAFEALCREIEADGIKVLERAVRKRSVQAAT
ncbi:MAG TPA: hypothetical protein VLC93_07910 [Myxococcota bacterium]|nr:hypothetical protein [Myxococcota bacterium]